MVKHTSISILKLLFMTSLLLCIAPSTEPCHPIDYKVLHEIQESMGSTPDLVSAFNLANDCCRGWAISCNENGRVIFFFASKGYTSTQIPSSISQLEFLQDFQFIYSPIYGSLPSTLTKLKYLTAIRVTGTNLNSTIPSFLGNMTNLLSIDLSSNSLHGPIPSSLGKIVGLTRLDLSNNHLSGQIPQSLGSCKALSFLDFSKNQLTGDVPKSLGQLNMEYVALGSNQLTGDASHLFQSKTGTLYLYSNRFAFNFSDVNVGSNLGYFDMSNNLVYGCFPPSIDNPVFYGFSVSTNRLCGPIPQSGTLQQFQADAFANNLCLCVIWVPLRRPAPAPSRSPFAKRDFLLTVQYISVRTVKNALSTFVVSKADVSMKNRLSLSANSLASSTGTARREAKSHLLPMSMITMFLSACPLNSSSHFAM
ncbi:hypothetical protein Droror1_Dr00012742 [Drosera rotundifolia]